MYSILDQGADSVETRFPLSTRSADAGTVPSPGRRATLGEAR